MLGVRKSHAKLGNKTLGAGGRKKRFAEARKSPTRSVTRRYRDVAVRADRRRRSFAREELRPVTIQTRRMLRKLRDVRKRRVAFTHFLPIARGNFVTRVTG